MKPTDAEFWTDLLICGTWLQLLRAFLLHSGPARDPSRKLVGLLLNIFGFLRSFVAGSPRA